MSERIKPLRKSQVDSDQHRGIRDAICAALGQWRRFLIAVDGTDHAGKSTLASYLGWQLGASVVHGDLYLLAATPEWDYNCLRSSLMSRLDADRPVIFEGVFALDVVDRLSLSPDFVIRVRNLDHPEGAGRWSDQFSAYFSRHLEADVDRVFRWGSAR